MIESDRKAPTAEELLRKLQSMSPADKLRAAAELLEAKRPRLALALAAGVVGDLQVLHMRGDL